MDRYWADSTGRRNIFVHILFEQLVENLDRCLPDQRFPRSRVQRICNGAQLFGTVLAEIRALGKVLAKHAVGVLVAATLPWALRVAEVDLETGIDPQLRVLSHLGPLVPSQWAMQMGRQAADRLYGGIPDSLGTMTGKGESIFTDLPAPCPSMRRCRSMLKRVVRSTSVPIAELPRPRMRSPSQWPGTALSPISAGRSPIIRASAMNALPRLRARSRGNLSARPDLRQAESSRLSSPRP